MRPVKPDNQQSVLVEFNPAPGLTNSLIMGLRDMTSQVPPQEFASYISSYVAAVAYIMHSNNSTETVIAVFTKLVEDAGRQFEHRKKLIEKEAANPLKHKP